MNEQERVYNLAEFAAVASVSNPGETMPAQLS